MTYGDIAAFAERLKSISAEVAALEDPHERLKAAHLVSEAVSDYTSPLIAHERYLAANAVIPLHPEWRSKIRGIADMLGVNYSTAGEIVNRRKRSKPPKD